ncbi:MAG: Peptidoglycan-binding domain 1 protein, partial [Cyanobacteria bacterium RYN_339]|nr:Peptidoglycan-binding domain 1 protein [Cyanobacteria bacterium RYN_339]
AILKGFFQNALDDIKQGNWAGALGQVTGDIGSFFVSGGAAGAGKVAATGGKVAEISMLAKGAKLAEGGALGSRVAKLAEAGELSAKVAKASELAKVAKLDKALALGQKAIGLGIDTSTKIFSLGLKGNFAAWNKVGKAVSGLPGMNKVMVLGEETAARVRNRLGVASKSEVPAAGAAPGSNYGNYSPYNPAHGVPARPLLEPGTQLKLPSVTNPANIRDYTVMGIENGQVKVMRNADMASRTIPAADIFKSNPELRRAFFERNVGEQVRIPSISAAGELRTGTIRGVRPDGMLYVQRNADGAMRVIDPATIFQTTPRYLEDFLRQIDPSYRGAERLAAGETRLNNVARLWEVTGDEGRIAINREHIQLKLRDRLNHLPPAELQWVEGTLRNTGTNAERLMIQRALAAGHDLNAVANYAADMRKIASGDAVALKSLGFNDAWVSYLQQMSPEQRVLRMSTLEGLQQHFTTSCNPTSYQIVRGEMDPLYSWNGNRNPESLIAEQKRLLEANQGIAVSKTPSTWEKIQSWFGKKQEGVGTYPEAMAEELNNLSGQTGVQYHPRHMDYAANLDAAQFPHSTPAFRQGAVQDLERSLRQGKPTEIYVQWLDQHGNAGSAPGKAYGAHAIGVLDTRILPNGEKQFLLHDPEFRVNNVPTPHTAWVNARDIVNGNLGPHYASGELYSYLSTT